MGGKEKKEKIDFSKLEKAIKFQRKCEQENIFAIPRSRADVAPAFIIKSKKCKHKISSKLQLK